MDARKRIDVGTILFHQDESEFSTFVESLQRASHEARNEARVRLTFKWNSAPAYSAATRCSEIFPGIEVTESDNTANVGFGEAHNTMMRQSFNAGADYYLCINPDGFVHFDLLRQLVSFASDKTDLGLLEAIQFPKEHPKPYDPFTGVTQWCSGACLLIPRSTYATLGGFDPNLFMYCEDIDLSWRVRATGLQCYTCPAAMFFHNVQESKPRQVRKLMFESARYLAHKWGAPEFQLKMEELLVADGFYPTEQYLPPLKQVLRQAGGANVAEWRQLLSFSVPRW